MLVRKKLVCTAILGLVALAAGADQSADEREVQALRDSNKKHQI